jgi:hypothetical protein
MRSSGRGCIAVRHDNVSAVCNASAKKYSILKLQYGLCKYSSRVLGLSTLSCAPGLRPGLLCRPCVHCMTLTASRKVRPSHLTCCVRRAVTVHSYYTTTVTELQDFRPPSHFVSEILHILSM